MVDCLRDQPDPTGSSPGFQAKASPGNHETRRRDQLVPQTIDHGFPYSHCEKNTKSEVFLLTTTTLPTANYLGLVGIVFYVNTNVMTAILDI